jgi:hypothetical protein
MTLPFCFNQHDYSPPIKAQRGDYPSLRKSIRATILAMTHQLDFPSLGNAWHLDYPSQSYLTRLDDSPHSTVRCIAFDYAIRSIARSSSRLT